MIKFDRIAELKAFISNYDIPFQREEKMIVVTEKKASFYVKADRFSSEFVEVACVEMPTPIDNAKTLFENFDENTEFYPDVLAFLANPTEDSMTTFLNPRVGVELSDGTIKKSSTKVDINKDGVFVEDQLGNWFDQIRSYIQADLDAAL